MLVIKASSMGFSVPTISGLPALTIAQPIKAIRNKASKKIMTFKFSLHQSSIVSKRILRMSNYTSNDHDKKRKQCTW